MDTVNDIRNKFIQMYKDKEFNAEGMLEIIGSSFIADEDSIFGELNVEYANAEISWYLSQSLNVNDIKKYYKLVPKIWQKVSDHNGTILSNYGHRIFNTSLGLSQYDQVLNELKNNPNSRRGSMIYTYPGVHNDSTMNNRTDMICTWGIQYYIRNNKLDCVVNMRSNHARQYGFANDKFWFNYVQSKLAKDLNVDKGIMIWQANSLHLYKSDFKLLDQYIKENNG